MNLGLRDAVFLAPVLMEHLRQSANAKSAADRAKIDAPLKKWGEWRHAQALKIIALANTVLGFSTWKNETQWYYGVIPVNWVWVRSWMIWAMKLAGLGRRNPWRLSGLANR